MPASASNTDVQLSSRKSVRSGRATGSSEASTARIAASASVGAFVVVGDDAVIGERTVIFPHVTIGRGARIGDDCVVHAQVSIREDVTIGNRVILQDGVVVHLVVRDLRFAPWLVEPLRLLREYFRECLRHRRHRIVRGFDLNEIKPEGRLIQRVDREAARIDVRGHHQAR